MTAITLSEDQQKAYEAFSSFIMNKLSRVFVLAGYSGTGKSTLVEYLMASLDNLMRCARLIAPDYPEYQVVLTATTNKAAENLSRMTGREVQTIHSAIGLRVHTDYATNTTKLIPRRGAQELYNSILFIDEASYIGKDLMKYILERTHNCKIVFIGDPAQLQDVSGGTSPVFSSNYPGVELTKVMRHTGPILELATCFRNTVFTGEFFSFKPDGQAIQYLDRNDFDQAILAEFGRPDWHYLDSKVLGWTNKCAITYNKRIRERIQGDPEFQVGDYAICNRFISTRSHTFKTDSTVQITAISGPEFEYGVQGRLYTIDGVEVLFMPNQLSEWKRVVKDLQDGNRVGDLARIDSHWIDLRAAYAHTINKAQGSTFKKVFIDLDDIKRCPQGNLLARLMYVGVSRASQQVIMTGDLV